MLPGRALRDTPYPGLVELARRGGARLGAGNREDLYPEMPPALSPGELERLIDEQRGPR